MVKLLSCPDIKTTRDKTWPYEEYFIGKKDADKRKNGQGENHWTGAKAQEWYTGCFIRDTMHGPGDYRWRHHGENGVAQTYEGYFYANRMHGYGTMSYPDGSVFRGLFHTDCRWGPGVITHISRQEDVGLWRGDQLVRLAWRPPTMSIVPDLMAVPTGAAFVEPHRVLLASSVHIIGETNSALDLLKHYGVSPAVASQKWPALYPKYCTDVHSSLFHKAVFDQAYYNGKIHLLKECVESDIIQNKDSGLIEDSTTYFAWNNSDINLNFMKHSFTHDEQRKKIGFDVTSILSGHRKRYKPPGKHELECRTLLMACYLGDIPEIIRLVNHCNVHPNVADMQGNTALMYAVCGDQTDVINFLLDAGASVNSYNDACYTALGIALMRYAAVARDVAGWETAAAMLPPQVGTAAKVPVETTVSEWNILRNQLALSAPPASYATGTKNSIRSASMKKIKSITSLKSMKSVTPIRSKQRIDQDVEIEEITDDRRIFNDILREYETQVNTTLSETGVTPVPYIFEINDMVKVIDGFEDEYKKPAVTAPKKNISKVLKDPTKPSKILIAKTENEDVVSITSLELRKQEKLDKIMLTILHLLSNKADPALVRCPQPALFLAIASNNSDLIRYLIQNGAYVHENLNQMLGYSALEVAVSRPLSRESLESVRALLENGAIANQRLQFNDNTTTDLSIQAMPGPTLLHAVLVKKTESYIEEEIRNAMLDLLLEFGCDANALFKGRSAMEMAMTKSIDILNVFIKNPNTNLNRVINDVNLTILVKMFTLPFCSTVDQVVRVQILTNLLLYGADPFIECQNGEDSYANLFVYAKKHLDLIENAKSGSVSGGKNEVKNKKSDSKVKKSEPKKPDDKKKVDKQGDKAVGKTGVDTAEDYQQSLELVTECARMLRIRWIQAKLLKELVGIVDKFKHRAWHMIIKEHKSQKKARLWLTPVRCLEIWDILKATHKKVYEDEKVLRMTLCIVQYYSMMDELGPKLKFKDKELIETEVTSMLDDRSLGSSVTMETVTWRRAYVQPELMTRCDQKFEVCFECGLPFTAESVRCDSCKIVSFCNMQCIKASVYRAIDHPCSQWLRKKYFPPSIDSLTD